MMVGLNLTFGPMHIVGLQGQARRTYIYRSTEGFADWNMVESIGAVILAVGILLFIINAVKTNRGPRNAPLDPWDARSYEWITASPPKTHNFDRIPEVHSIDEFFHRKYQEDPDTGVLTQVATAEEILAHLERHADTNLHLPSPSYWPIVVAFGLPVVGIGLIFNYVIAVVGGFIVLTGVYGWAQEPSVASGEDDDPPSADSTELVLHR